MGGSSRASESTRARTVLDSRTQRGAEGGTSRIAASRELN